MYGVFFLVRFKIPFVPVTWYPLVYRYAVERHTKKNHLVQLKMSMTNSCRGPRRQAVQGVCIWILGTDADVMLMEIICMAKLCNFTGICCSWYRGMFYKVVATERELQ